MKKFEWFVWENKYFTLSFNFWKMQSGLVCLYWDGKNKFENYNFHLFVMRKDWFWGYSEDSYDSSIKYFGLGPLFLFCWMN